MLKSLVRTEHVNKIRGRYLALVQHLAITDTSSRRSTQVHLIDSESPASHDLALDQARLVPIRSSGLETNVMVGPDKW